VDPFAAPSIHDLATAAVAFSFQHGLLWYRIPAAVASLLLLLAAFLGKGRRSDFLYLLAIALFLFAQRWPALAIADLEGDESLTVSAALSRYLDPSYGVALFTGSAGPLLSYPVAALGLLGLRIDFGASKLVSLLLMIATSGLFYLALRTFCAARTGRIAVLPLIAFLGLSNRHWTISYCSEQWIDLLVISMIYGLLRLDARIGREPVNLAGMGLALGLMPLVKWQGMPIAVLVAACGVVLVASRILRERAGLGQLAIRLLPLALPSLAPLVIWCAIVWSQGSLGFFFDTYFAGLLHQATSRYPTTFAWRLQAMPSWGFPAYSLERWFLFLTALFWVPGAIVLWLSRRRGRARLELALAFLYLAVSLYAVLQPGGSFPHYLNLLLLPWAMLFALIFCRLCQAVARPILVWVPYLGLAVAVPALISLQDVPLPVRFPPTEFRARSLEALRELQIAGRPMIQWGWAYVYYIHSGTSWGNRSGGSNEILERFFQNKQLYIADYVESIESGRAPVFLDTAMEASMVYADREQWGHEQVPEVGEAVRRNYFACAEFPGARLFLLRTRYEGRKEIEDLCARYSQRTPPKQP
jgi:hypothetical protein